MSYGLITAAYIIAALFFILSLSSLSRQESARHGNLFGIAGMAIALFVTIFAEHTTALPWVVIAMLFGEVIGIYKAHRVMLIQMLELIAIMIGIDGCEAVVVGFYSIDVTVGVSLVIVYI